jgi:hypothetical protein
MAVFQYKCKGVDNKTPTAFAGLGFSYFQQNARIYNGAFVPIGGKLKMNSSALNAGAVVRGATSWFDPTNSYVAGVAVAGAKIYTTQWGDTGPLTFTDRTGAMTITNSGFRTFASLNGLLIVAGGSAAGDVLIKTASTTGNFAVLGGTPPKGDCVIVVNNYLFVGRQLNAAGTKSTVNWSAVSDPETWSAGDAVDFRKNDGDEITALAAIGTDLIIFKNNSVGRLSTTGISVGTTYTLGPLVTISDKIGTLSPLSVDQLPDGTLVFLGADANLYRCDGNQITKINDTSSPGPNYLIFSTTFDPSTLNTYFLCVNKTFNEVRIKGGIVYNYVDNYWYTDSSQSTENLLFTVGPRRGSALYSPYLLCAGTTDGFIVSYDGAGAAVPTDVSGSVTPTTIIFNLPIQELGFIPRFAKLLVRNLTSASATFPMKVAWDADPLFGTAVTPPFASNSPYQTLRFALPLAKTATAAIPSNLSILINPTFSGVTGSVSAPDRGFQFYFSDSNEF